MVFFSHCVQFHLMLFVPCFISELWALSSKLVTCAVHPYLPFDKTKQKETTHASTMSAELKWNTIHLDHTPTREVLQLMPQNKCWDANVFISGVALPPPPHAQCCADRSISVMKRHFVPMKCLAPSPSGYRTPKLSSIFRYVEVFSTLGLGRAKCCTFRLRCFARL
jgi:hypothetical protein